MRIGAWSENLTEERCVEIGVARLSRADLFRRSDFVSVHLRLSGRTAGLISDETLGMMRNDTYLINTSRAAVVDEDALVLARLDGVLHFFYRWAGVDIVQGALLRAESAG